MTLGDRFDYWSIVALAVIVIYGWVIVFGNPSPGSLSLGIVGIAIFAVSAVKQLRERVPAFHHLVGIYVGVAGVYRLAIDGPSLLTALFILAGIAAVAELLYEGITGRSVNLGW